MPDLTVTIKIPSAKVTQFKQSFNRLVKKPPEHQHLTDEQFFKQYIKDLLKAIFKNGSKQIEIDQITPVDDSNIVDVT